MCLTETGDTPGALQAYEVALIREPQSIAILKARAKTYLKAGRVNDALTDLNSILEIDSISEEPLYIRGRLELANGRYSQALNDFELLNRHYPENPDGSLGIAQCLSQMDKQSDAISYYRHALKLDPSDECYKGLASALINTGKEEEAFEIIREAIEQFPRDGLLYLMRGIINKNLYRTQEAASDKKIAVNLGIDPKYADQVLPLSPKVNK